jgi:hypothetical protein
VRGTLIGPECLATTLDESPIPIGRVSTLGSSGGGRLALIGFGSVVLLTVLPWSHGRSSGSSGYLGAWTPHWSLVAALAGLAGLAFAIFVWRRPVDLRLEVPVLAGLAVAVALASVAHHRHPPLLSVSSWAPIMAVGGAAIAFLGAVLKGLAGLRARRSVLDSR